MTNPVRCRIHQVSAPVMKWVPYPGWRYRFDPNGTVHHEKIPTVWDRLKSIFVRGGE